MINPDDMGSLDTIERLQKNLYSRKHPPVVTDGRTPISTEEFDVKSGWQHAGVDPVSGEPVIEAAKRPSSFFRRILIISLCFFILCSGLALLIFFGGFNIISSNNVNIEVAGPVSVGGGQELPLEITIENKNNTDLEYANLMIEYPEGTRNVEDINKELLRTKQELGTIEAGDSIKIIAKSLLFGQENTKKDIKIVAEYKVKGSNGTFFKEKTFQIVLNTSPVSVTVETLNEVNANQDFETRIDITSNSNTPLTNVLLTAEYPFGYLYKKASPTPSFDNAVWELGSFEPGEKKTITMTGRIEGQDGEERTLRFVVGSQSTADEKIIKTPFVTNLQSIAIKKPFIGITLGLNGDGKAEYVHQEKGNIRGVVVWKNNLPTRITDAEIEVVLNGTIFDRSSVTADGGFFRSVDNTILWDKRGSDLSVLEPGETGQVGFGFSPNANFGNLKNPNMTIEVNVRGKRTSESNVPEAILSSISKKIKIATALELNARSVYSIGPFTNTGPVPPEVEKPTTYTVVWSVKNSINNVGQAVVTATLPPYVKWLNVISPSSEKIAYNQARNEIVWQVSQVVAGTGMNGQTPREVAFQVEFLPSLTQVDQLVPLMSTVHMTAQDIFTNTQVSAEAEGATTELFADPQYANTDTSVRR